MKRLKLLEDENAKLRKLVADLSLDREMLQDVICGFQRKPPTFSDLMPPTVLT
jgi:hypothetical protein